LFVTNGLYVLSSPIAITQGVHVVSVNGPQVTTIDGMHSNRCVFLDNTDAILEGFTIRGGYVEASWMSAGGGGVLAYGGTVRNCRIMDSEVRGDSALGAGGGIQSMGVVEDCVIVGNRCLHGAGGGASLAGEGGIIRSSYVGSNRADWAGGLMLGRGAEAERCEVTANIGTLGCGGIGLFTAAYVCDCVVTKNSGQFGGGILAEIGLPVMGETAGIGIRNTTICANEGPNCGGLIISRIETGNVDVVNSIIYGNAGLNYSNSVGPCSYAHTCTFPLVRGIGNITNDPQLTPSYRLKTTSPCIDAGTASNAPLTDIDGEVRWDHPGHSNVVSIVDIGADEFVDADLDHMADYWEAETFGGTTNSNGTADDDGDDLSDLGEYENSTDPDDADSDADQMPDGWEVGNELDPLADDAGEDPDTDTMGNRGEYVADTDPRNPESVLSVTDVAAELGGIRIDWKGGRQAWQFLECRGELGTNAPWTPILAVPPPSPLTNAIIDFGNSNQTLFYRIRAER